MYTQCPECDVAFRVTAEVLKMAAGKVRCGGCGSAFNALEYLSEEKPAPRARRDPEPDLPELTPDDRTEAGDAEPEAISAEQSAALLKTLDELAGEDIRIEDTGVEWRVIAPGHDSDNPDRDNDGDDQPAGDDLNAADDSGIRQMRFDDDTPLPEDFEFESEAIVAPERSAPEPAADAEPDFMQVDLELGEPDEWEDLLGEVGGGDDERGSSGNGMEAESDSAASSTGIEVEEAEPDDADTGTGHEAASDTPDDASAAQRDPGDQVGAYRDGIGEESDDEPFPFEISDDELEAGAIELADDLPFEESPTEIETELAALDEDAAGAEDDDTAGEPGDAGDVTADGEADWPAPESYEIPELTEEEKTINMMIDQDLLAIAVEDEDGFASTIVQKQPGPDIDDAGESDPAAEDEAAGASPLFETIVMEAETPETEEDAERWEAGRAARVAAADAASGRGRQGMIAGAVLLALALVAQWVHYSREALATVPAFNDAIGPLYRAIGRPVSPDWNVSGWRFEATKGSTDATGERLTIYSRIGNTSDADLPLPLVHVSLTDRFEEITGSRVLEPAEYLVGDADPRQAIPPGQTFDAVITIENPSSEATGFQLNVCYRLASGRLRCAIEDFR